MKKAWSFFWLVVAWCIGLTLIAGLVKPYLGIIVLIVMLGLIVYLCVRVYRAVSNRRSHF